MHQDNARIAELTADFQDQFNAEPDAIVRAPGRVEVMGGHTDYNDGFVMPAAIDRDTLIALRQVPGNDVTIWSCNFGQKNQFGLGEIVRSDEAPWSNYIRGVIDQLKRSMVLVPGMEMAVVGNIPLGSGLSSSASLEVATAYAVLAINDGAMPGKDIALLCQRAENQFVGVNSGIMDQFISVLGKRNSAMFLDCRSLDYQFVQFPEDINLVVCDSKKPRTLASSEYNVRRAQCEEAVKILSGDLPGIKALRDVSSEDLDRYDHKLPEVVRNRARHIVRENGRALAAVDALNANDIAAFGALVNESHESARDLYEITIPEMDILQKAAAGVKGCYGSRISGAGFGGCTVNIVQADAIDEFMSVVRKKYLAETGIDPSIDVLSTADGATRIR